MCLDRTKVGCEKVTIWSGGNRCLDWSSFGRQDGWSGKDTIPFMSWLFSMKKILPHIWIQECTPRFDMSLFHEALGGEYIIQERCISPQDVGWPVSRKRQWSIGVRKDQFEVVVDLNSMEFETLFFREIATKCDVFFDDTEENRAKAVQLLRRPCERNLDVPEPSDLSKCLSPGGAYRLQGYVCKCVSEPQFKFSDVVVANVSQDPRGRPVMMSNVLPCLLTRSVMVLLKSKMRSVGPEQKGPLLMTALEHLTAMGWPLWASEQNQQTFCMQDAVHDLSPAFVKHLASNGMHIAVAGAMLLYALSCTRRVQP